APELAAVVRERRAGARRAALDLAEEDDVGPAGRLLDHSALERGERVGQERLAVVACGRLDALELVGRLGRKAQREVGLVLAEDVHGEAPGLRDGLAGLRLAVQAD